jgi:ribokinase
VRIVVVGSYNVGLTVIGDRLPVPGETVLGHTFDMGPGGKGSNQAIGAARLGADVTLVAKIGTDSFGRDARDLFAREGLAGPGIMEADTHTGVGLILVADDGHNMISVAPGANGLLTGPDLDDVADLFAGDGLLMCQLEAPADLYLEAATRARNSGFKILLNPAPAVPLPDEAFALTDYLTPNEHELAVLAGPGDDAESAAMSLLAKGVGEVIVTLGEEGVMRVTPDGSTRFPAHRVEAVDTTGAGDAFNAGFAAALAQGQAVPEAIALGARAGAFCVTRIGVIDGLATADQLDDEVPA